MPEPNLPAYEFDVFVSYASEDREDFVHPLIEALEALDLRVWVDYGQIEMGDSVRSKIDEGLVRSRFSVVVLSGHSLEKYWTNLEWDGLLALEDVTKAKRVLPVLHRLEHSELAVKSPILAGKLSGPSSAGIDSVAHQIERVVRRAAPISRSQKTNLYGVPRRQQGFVGRTADLERIESAVLKGDTTVSASISGLAGIGKTALATELAHRLAHAGHFRGGIFWLNAESGDLNMAWAADDIGGQLAGPMLPVERAAATVRFISRSKSNVLIVLDNVTAWGATSQPGPLPQGAHVHLLLTTQESDLGGTDFEQVRLDVLEPAEAKQLLLEVAGRDIEPGVNDLLSVLEGHALAIELVGALLRDEGTAAEYLSSIDRESLEEEVAGRVRYERTTTQALDAVWERLDESTRIAWCTGAQFEPESVGLVISDAVGIKRQERRALRRYHLIQSAKEGAEQGRWKMHRLVRNFGRSQARGECLATACQRHDEGLRQYSKTIDLSSGFAPYQAERIHLDAATVRALEREKTIIDAYFFDRIAAGRQSSGDLEGAAALREKAIEVQRELLGEDDPSTLALMCNFAGTLRAQGDLQGARGLGEEVLEAFRTLLGEDDPSTLTSMSSLAQTLKAQGDLGGARALGEKVLEAFRTLYGDDHLSTLTSMSNLAQTLFAQGDLEEAKAIEEKVLEVRRELLGEGHRSTLTSMNNLAQTLKAQGDLEGARTLEEKELEACRTLLGDDHPSTLTSMNNLAETLKAQGDLDGAWALAVKSFEGRRELLGEHHPSTLTSMNNLASMLKAQGDLAGARALGEEVLEVQRELLGDDHPSTLTSMSNLAFTLEAQGGLEGARILGEKALEVRSALLGDDHPSTLTSMNNVARTLVALGENGKALELVASAVAGARRVWGDEHPKTKSLVAFLKKLQP